MYLLSLVSFLFASVGRIIFELHKDVAPKTVDNFRSLCTGKHLKIYFGANKRKTILWLCTKGSSTNVLSQLGSEKSISTPCTQDSFILLIAS